MTDNTEWDYDVAEDEVALFDQAKPFEAASASAVAVDSEFSDYSVHDDERALFQENDEKGAGAAKSDWVSEGFETKTTASADEGVDLYAQAATIAKALHMVEEQVSAVLQYRHEGGTADSISRYRQDYIGGLSKAEVQSIFRAQNTLTSGGTLQPRAAGATAGGFNAMKKLMKKVPPPARTARKPPPSSIQMRKKFRNKFSLKALNYDYEHRQQRAASLRTPWVPGLRRCIMAGGDRCVETVQTFLQDPHVDINAPLTSNGNCALHLACIRGDLRLVQLLVQCSADLQKLNEDGFNAVHMASTYMRDDILSFLTAMRASAMPKRRWEWEGVDLLYPVASTTGKLPVEMALEKKADYPDRVKDIDSMAHRQREHSKDLAMAATDKCMDYLAESSLEVGYRFGVDNIRDPASLIVQFPSQKEVPGGIARVLQALWEGSNPIGLSQYPEGTMWRTKRLRELGCVHPSVRECGKILHRLKDDVKLKGLKGGWVNYLNAHVIMTNLAMYPNLPCQEFDRFIGAGAMAAVAERLSWQVGHVVDVKKPMVVPKPKLPASPPKPEEKSRKLGQHSRHKGAPELTYAEKLLQRKKEEAKAAALAEIEAAKAQDVDLGGGWYKAVLAKIYTDGTYKVKFVVSGDVLHDVQWNKIRDHIFSELDEDPDLEAVELMEQSEQSEQSNFE